MKRSPWVTVLLHRSGTTFVQLPVSEDLHAFAGAEGWSFPRTSKTLKQCLSDVPISMKHSITMRC